MTLANYLERVAEIWNQPDLKLNAHGVCEFTIGSGPTVAIEEETNGHTAHFYSSLFRLSPGTGESLCKLLLQAQLFGKEIGVGQAFGIDSESSELFLCRSFHPGEFRDSEAFLSALEDFIKWAGHWQQKLAHSQFDPEAVASEQLDNHMLRI